MQPRGDIGVRVCGRADTDESGDLILLAECENRVVFASADEFGLAERIAEIMVVGQIRRGRTPFP